MDIAGIFPSRIAMIIVFACSSVMPHAINSGIIRLVVLPQVDQRAQQVAVDGVVEALAGLLDPHTKADWGYFAPENPDKILIMIYRG